MRLDAPFGLVQATLASAGRCFIKLWHCKKSILKCAHKTSLSMCLAAGPYALCSQLPSALYLTLLCSQRVFWFVRDHSFGVGREVVCGRQCAQMLNRVHVQNGNKKKWKMVSYRVHVRMLLPTLMSVCVSVCHRSFFQVIKYGNIGCL